MSTEPSVLTGKAKSFFSQAAWILGIAAVLGAAYLLPLPPQFKRQGIPLADELLLLLLLSLIFLTFRFNGRGAGYIRLGSILIAFLLPLLRLWQTADSTWNIVLGLLPWADATEYYFDANRLLQGGLFSAFSGRRPFFASFLTAVLQLSHQDLQIVLLMFTILNGLVVFLFVEEVHNEFGPVSAITGLYLAQLFYRPFAGTTLTEQLGYPAGLLALIVLLRGVRAQKMGLFALGLMLLTYALMVRAGAFIVLPVLVVFAVLQFAQNLRQSLKVCLLMLAAVAIPVFFSAWLERTVAAPNAVEFANFADTLYGQARGGLRWTQAAIEHPELASMPEPARSQYLYRLAFQEIKDHPSGLVQGALKAWLDFLRPGPWGAFGFLAPGNRTIDFMLQLLAVLVFLAGIWLLWMNRARPLSKLMLAFWVGIFLSIPFLPPIDAGVRPYTGTAALLFLPVCFVFTPGLFKRASGGPETRPVPPIGLSHGLALGLICLSLIGAPLTRKMTQPVALQNISCGPGTAAIQFKLHPGSYILVSPGDSGQTRVPLVPLSDLHKSFDDFPYGEFAGLMRKLKQPALIAVTADARTGQGMWIVGPPALKDAEDKLIGACAEMRVATYPVMFIRTLEIP
ncbi:MAG: hypothetical protein ACM3XO_28640 [Bacteroidota bacterium]